MSETEGYGDEPIEQDGTLDVPVCDCDSPVQEPNDMSNVPTDPTSAEMLRLHALNGSQRAADGAQAYAENQRMAYLEGKDTVSLTEALGPRYMQGPHPYHGSPDGK